MKKVLIYLVLLMAVGMAGIVAYVSVNGLLKVFAGAGTLGLLFFISIEIAKIVATSAIHTYSKKIGWVYSSLLSIGVLISMIITSVGIYGFLSTSYKESYNNMIATENKVELIEGKKKLLVDSKENLTKDIALKRERISKILEVRKQQEVRLDSLYAKNWITTAKRTEKIITEANEDMKNIENEINGLTERLNVINDSINVHSLRVIELNQNNEGASELNSLKYLSDVTGKSMDEVMKWFIFLLIVIGDPMAVLMVIVFNKIVNKKVEDDAVDDAVNDAIDDAQPSPPINDVVDDLTDLNNGNVDKVKKPIKDIEVTDSIVVEPEANKVSLEPVSEVITKPVIEKPKTKITRDDIKEIKERGFSVDIPERQKNNTIDRIGSNKEIRNGNADTIYYKRTGGNSNEDR